MKTPYLYLTEDCIRRKDKLADDEHNKSVSNYYDIYDLNLPCDYNKEMLDVKKILAIKKEIVDASLHFDNYLQQFHLQSPKLIYKSYDDLSKYTSIVCDHYNICNDIRNIILSFAIDKRRYNKEKRELRKKQKEINII